MEPLFKYAGHGSAVGSTSRTCRRMRGRPARPHAGEPCTDEPRLPPLVARHRRGALPQLRHRRDHVVQRAHAARSTAMMQGQAPRLLLPALPRERVARGASTWSACASPSHAVWEYVQPRAARRPVRRRRVHRVPARAAAQPRGARLGALLARAQQGLSTASSTGSSSGATPRCRSGSTSGTATTSTRSARRSGPWDEQTAYADWVKPITYQHQSGEVFAKEMGFFARRILRDFAPDEFVPAM